MIERTLVIGSTGFIGHHVVRHLHAHDHTVVGMRRWHSADDLFRSSEVADVVADLSERRTLVQAIGGFNRVVYCAAPDPNLEPGEYRAKAVTWIRNVLEIARDEDVERVVVTSTAATIDPSSEGQERPASEEDVYLPGSAGDHFVEAAYAVEQECFRQAADGQSVLILNPTVVLGPGARFPSIDHLRSTPDDAPVNRVEVERVAAAHRAALQLELEPSLEPGRRGNRYLVAGENTTIGELYDTIERRDDVETFGGGGLFGSSDETYRNRHLLTDGCHVDDARACKALGL